MAPPAKTNTGTGPAAPSSDGLAFLTAVESDLDALRHFQPNWDSYGAPRIAPEVIAAACRFVRNLPQGLARQPRVVPMSTGTLQLEWHDGPRILELEFETPQTIRYLKWHPERSIEEEDTFQATEIDKAIDLIQWFMSGTSV